jgi:membrane associated rhomboid family serine protease
VIPLKDNIPTLRFPIVTVLLIAVNIGFFVWQLTVSSSPVPQLQGSGFSYRDEKQVELGAIPYRLTHPGKDCALGSKPTGSGNLELNVVCQGTADYASESRSGNPFVKVSQPPWYLTIFSSMFMHGGWLHIIFNMLFLWIFGNNIEDTMGRLKFLLFYLLAGIVALYAQVALSPDSTVPTLGASGAIAGVLGAYALLYPRARVLTLIIIIFFVTLVEIPAWIMLGLWFVLQFVPAIGQVATPDIAGGGGVAYFAHVGGFIFGLAAVKLFTMGRSPPGDVPRIPVY